MSAQGNVRYALKTPYRDGTTHVMFEPLDFLARLAALVSAPGVNLTRFHGVFAPHHRLRAKIVPGCANQHAEETEFPTPGRAPPAVRMNWARRLKRVFRIDIEKCEHCGGRVKIIASIEDPDVIEKILRHLGPGESAATEALPGGHRRARDCSPETPRGAAA